jgi:RHS repeat-associated protein
MTQITYPSGRVVVQSVDAIGRLCAVGASGSTCSSGTTYATGYGYNAAQELTGFNYGNGVAATFGYSNDRLQLTSLNYKKGASTLFGLSYSYGAAGSNNGQIQSITDSVDNGRNATYTYDTLARLSTAVTTGSANYPAWGLQQSYDRYGNRLSQTAISGCTGIPCPQPSVVVSAATNRITGSPFAYDGNGNMTNDGINPLVYDAENHAVSSSSGAYSYDGKGLRVKKCLPNCTSPTTTTIYLFSGSKVLAEYDNGAAPTAPSREYVYSGGALLAKIDSSGTKYYHQDHLSNRLVTDSSGTTSAQLGHFPFGESWYNASNDKLRFTSYERDAESGNDFAMARYHINRLGRFSAPDPVAGSIGDPQSLNRYGYVGNNPVNAVDPLGLVIEMAPCGVHPDGSPQWFCPSEGDGGVGLSSGILQMVFCFYANCGTGGGGPSGDTGGSAQGDPLTASQKVLDQMYCLWKKSRYGFQRTERSMWITEQNGELDFPQWPWSAESGKETWQGRRPSGSIAIAHTHPNALSPKPSTTGGNTGRGDQGTADAQGLPVYVVTREAIWKAVPNQKDPSQVAEGNWWKDSEKSEKKGDLKCP